MSVLYWLGLYTLAFYALNGVFVLFQDKPRTISYGGLYRIVWFTLAAPVIFFVYTTWRMVAAGWLQ